MFLQFLMHDIPSSFIKNIQFLDVLFFSDLFLNTFILFDLIQYVISIIPYIEMIFASEQEHQDNYNEKYREHKSEMDFM